MVHPLIEHDRLGDDDTLHRDVEASVALVGRGILDIHASHGTRHEFMGSHGTEA